MSVGGGWMAKVCVALFTTYLNCFGNVDVAGKQEDNIFNRPGTSMFMMKEMVTR
jgi:hypothetical protein